MNNGVKSLAAKFEQGEANNAEGTKIPHDTICDGGLRTNNINRANSRLQFSDFQGNFVKQVPSQQSLQQEAADLAYAKRLQQELDDAEYARRLAKESF